MRIERTILLPNNENDDNNDDNNNDNNGYINNDNNNSSMIVLLRTLIITIIVTIIMIKMITDHPHLILINLTYFNTFYYSLRECVLLASTVAKLTQAGETYKTQNPSNN